ncbi:MAG: hypothetical protein RLZZ241_842 [Bacteroidota bacterium]|jgi:hypothetical protein
MKLKTEIKWALIFTATTLLWMLLEKFSGLHSTHIALHQYLTNLFAIPAILVYVFALKEKKNKDLGGAMSYKQGFISGMLITLFVTMLSAPTQWVVSEIITPEYFPNVIAYSLKSGYFQTQVEAEAYFNLENYMFQSVMGALLMGIMTTAIVAFFMKSKK